MKKILAILLVGVMSVTAFGFNASAVEKTDAEIQQEKLGYILNLNKDIWLDCAVIYDGVWPSIMDNAREVYDTDGLSADEYTVALKQVYDTNWPKVMVSPLISFDNSRNSKASTISSLLKDSPSKLYIPLTKVFLL